MIASGPDLRLAAAWDEDRPAVPGPISNYPVSDPEVAIRRADPRGLAKPHAGGGRLFLRELPSPQRLQGVLRCGRSPLGCVYGDGLAPAIRAQEALERAVLLD